MKAIILEGSGGIENLSIEETDLPEVRPNEILVKVVAFAVNPVDTKTRKGGFLLEKLQEDGPVILGWDISGVVDAVGTEVTSFKRGDEVFGMVNFPGSGKAYAEFVAAPQEHLSLKPKNISHEEAAASSLAALTAFQALVYQAKVSVGQQVLIHAAAGGVGHFAVQIAKHLGATVIGTASSSNKSFLQDLGVDTFIDYTQDQLQERLDQVDVVLDPIGGDTTEQSLKVLKNGGVLISIVGGVKDHLKTLIDEKGVKAENYLVHSSGWDMRQLAELLEKGVIIPHISHHFSFDQIAQAHQQIETGKTRGKVVVSIP